MNNLALNQTKTMLSTEIVKIINEMREEGAAELRHNDFMAKILKVLGEDGARKFSHTYRDSQNKERPCYNLPKREAQLMVMSESYKVQAAVYDRMVELEAQAQPPALNPANLTRLQLLEMAMQSEQERLLLEATVKAIKPKADALDRIATGSEGSFNITNTAKTLQMRPKDLFAWLSANHWIYRRAGGKSWVAYQDRIQSGLLEHKITTVERSDGTEKVVEQVLVTPKGLAKLSGVMSQKATPQPRNGLVLLQGAQA